MSALVSSTNRSKTSYVREASNTPGTTPNNPAWKEVRLTSSGLQLTPTRGRSNVIRPDGQAGSTFLLDRENGGDIGIEHAFGHYDDFYESALKSAWVKKAERDNNGTADSVITDVAASSDTYTVADAAIDFAVGHLVLATGFTNAENNLLFRAAASTSGTAVISPNGRVDEAAPPATARLKAVGFEGASGDIVATTTGGNALTSSSLDFTTLGIQVGEWMLIGGASAGTQFATAANNGWARVSAVAANRLSFDVVPPNFDADAGTSKTVQVFFGDFLKNGTTIHSYSFERQQQDLTSPTYEYFRGDFLNTLALTITGGREITGSFGFLGLGGDPIGTTRVSGSTDVAPPSYGTMTASSNVGSLAEGGVSLIGGVNCMTEGTLNINNNITRTPVVGPIGSAAINVGELMASGNFSTYLGDGSILAKAANDTLTSLSFLTSYGSGNREGYFVDVPAVKLNVTSNVQGKNQGRMVSGTWEGEPHPTLGYTISIGRFFYLPA